MSSRWFVLVCSLVAVPAALPAQAHTAWPDAQKPQKHLLRHAVEVVTFSEPGVRQPCFAVAIDATTLTCDSPDGAGHILFPRSNVAAIAEMYKPFWTPRGITALILTGGAITVAVINPLVLLPIGVIVLAVETMPTPSFGPPPPPRNPYRERLLYQRAGTRLSIDLDSDWDS